VLVKLQCTLLPRVVGLTHKTHKDLPNFIVIGLDRLGFSKPSIFPNDGVLGKNRAFVPPSKNQENEQRVKDSSRGLLASDAVQWCGRIQTFRRTFLDPSAPSTFRVKTDAAWPS